MDNADNAITGKRKAHRLKKAAPNPSPQTSHPARVGYTYTARRSRCQRPPIWRHLRVTVMEPPWGQRNDATSGAAERSQVRVTVKAPLLV